MQSVRVYPSSDAKSLAHQALLSLE